MTLGSIPGYHSPRLDTFNMSGLPIFIDTTVGTRDYFKLFDRELRKRHPRVRLTYLSYLQALGGNFLQKELLKPETDVVLFRNLEPPYYAAQHMAKNGWIQSLNKLLPNQDFSQLRTICPWLYSWKNKVYGLPKNMAFYMLMANAELMTEFGFPMPTHRDQLLEQCLEAKTRMKMGSVFQLDGTRLAPHYISWLWANGGTLLSHDGSPNVTSSASLSTLEFLYQLIHRHGIISPDFHKRSPSHAILQMATNKTLFLESDSDMIYTLDRLDKAGKRKVKYALTLPLPGPGGKALSSFPCGPHYAVPANTRHEETARILLSFLLDFEATRKIEKSGRYPFSIFKPTLATLKSKSWQESDFEVLSTTAEWPETDIKNLYQVHDSVERWTRKCLIDRIPPAKALGAMALEMAARLNKTPVPRSIQSGIDYIKLHLGEPDLNIKTVSTAAGITPLQFSKLVRLQTGKSFRNYIQDLRVQRAIQLIQSHHDEPLKSIALKSGFRDIYYFSTIFKKVTNQSPALYKKSVI